MARIRLNLLLTHMETKGKSLTHQTSDDEKKVFTVLRFSDFSENAVKHNEKSEFQKSENPKTSKKVWLKYAETCKYSPIPRVRPMLSSYHSATKIRNRK